MKGICTVCHYVNSPDARFCVICGSPLKPKCPNCGGSVEDDQNFCGNCGNELSTKILRRDVSPASYTPAHLIKRILAERHLLVGERKLVTVLFVDIVDSTASIEGADPEDADRYLTDALRGMMDAIHLYEGTVNALRGDGVMALFGAPIAHEDHAVRAARAALIIPNAVAAETAGKAHTRVGLHTGEVLVRGVGNDLSIEYQAQGPTVHLAARMEGLAEPGKTYITNEVRRLIDGYIETRHVGPTHVKGLSEPVEVFELTRALESSPWEARASRGLVTFTGRGHEMDHLRRMLTHVCSRRGRAVVILGEAGIGKSRLVHEFLASDNLEGLTLVKSEASPFEINTAYYPIKGVIHSWLGTEPGNRDIPVRLEAALRTLDLRLLPTLPVLAALVDTPIEGSYWAELTPEQRKRQTRDAIRALVHALAEQGPLIVVIEDLHWIDGETQIVLDDLVAATVGMSLLLLLTHRPEYQNQWSSQAHVKQIHLEPLPQESALELLDFLIGTDQSVNTLKPRLVARTGGTPLFLEETVRTLAESGALDGTRGDYVAARNDLPLEIPDSVQAVLAARIDRLDPRDKNVLQVASVAGEYVPVKLISDVTGQSEEDIHVTLSRLQAKEFLHEHRVLPSQEFRFGHALVQEVTYGSLPKKRRKKLHAHIVDRLEASEYDSSAERLSYHATRGELWEKAARYCLEAADKSIDKSAFREASAFLRAAMRSLDCLPQAQDVVETAIDVRMKLRVAETGAPGGLATLVKDLQRAADLAVSIGDKMRQTRVAIHYGYVANMLGEKPVAEVQAQQAYDLAQEIDDRYLTVESRILLAQTHSYSGMPRGVLSLLMPHMGYLTHDIRHETMGQTMIRSVVACAHIATTEAAQGHFVPSAKWEAEGCAIADEAGRPFDLVYMQLTRGICLDFKGEMDASVAAHEKAVEIAEANDIWFMMTFAQPWRGHALHVAGRHEEAMEVLRTTQAAARRAELPLVEAECRGFAAQVCLALGDTDTARDDAQAALAFGLSHEVPLLELVGLRSMGRLDEALAVAEQWGYAVWAQELRTNQ